MEELLANADPAGQLLCNIITGALLGGGLVVAFLLSLHHRSNPPDPEALTSRIAARAWSTFHVGIMLGALFLLYFLASFIGLFFYEGQIPLVRLVITILLYSILASLIAFINRRRGDSWTTSSGMGLGQMKKLLLSPVFYLACIPFIMLATKAYHLLLHYFFGMEIGLQDAAKAIAQEPSWLKILYVLAAILVAPIFEELLFRGLVFPYLVKRTGLAGGTALVSLLFAAMHFHLPSVVPLFLLSTALCLAYWRTGSLWVGIGMHAIFNAVSILALNMVG